MEPSFAFLVSELRRDFVRYCNARLAENGMTQGLYYFVLYVGKHPDCTQKEMAEFLRMDPAHTARSVAKMVAEGFMEQRVRPSDRRAHALRLSPRGQEIYRLCHNLFAEWDHKMLDGLSETERAQLSALLGKLPRPWCA